MTILYSMVGNHNPDSSSHVSKYSKGPAGEVLRERCSNSQSPLEKGYICIFGFQSLLTCSLHSGFTYVQFRDGSFLVHGSLISKPQACLIHSHERDMKEPSSTLEVRNVQSPHLSIPQAASVLKDSEHPTPLCETAEAKQSLDRTPLAECGVVELPSMPLE